MFSNKVVHSILIILMLRILRVYSLNVSELNIQHPINVIRQTKAEEILSFMNQTVDPCEDFFEYACGNYGKLHPTNTTMSYMEEIQNAMNKKIQLEMETDDDSSDLDIDKTMKNFYRSCINAPNMADVYKDKLKDLLKEFGSMPVLEGDSWQENEFKWNETWAHIAYKTGIYSVISIEPVEDMQNNTIRRIQIGEPPFPLGRALYIDESITKEKIKYTAKMIKNLQIFLGVEQKLAETTAKEMLDFETALVRGSTDWMLGIPFEKIYILNNTDEIQQKYLPIWDTKQLFGNAVNYVPAKAIAMHKYLEHTKKVLQETPKRIVANYMYYDLLSAFMYKLEETEEERTKACIWSLKDYFYRHLMNLIYRKHFNEQMKEGIHYMWQELKAAWLRALESPRLNWMQEDTRKHAIVKMHAMKLKISSFEDYKDIVDFTKLPLNNHDYVYNLKLIMDLYAQKTRAKYHQPPQSAITTSFSPFYIFTFNSIGIPLDVLQPFYAWSSSYPYAYNFANLGFYIAHEILHGFDSDGRSFDSKGNMEDWWDSESENEFLSKKQCFVNQYKSYMYGGRALPEMQAQGENIADNGGVRLAFDAFKTWYKSIAENLINATEAETFPGLDYSNEKLFFLSYAQAWCATTHPDYMAAQAATDIHVPEKFRVIGPLANLEEFGKAFNCPEGSVMNPVNKCEIY